VDFTEAQLSISNVPTDCALPYTNLQLKWQNIKFAAAYKYCLDEEPNGTCSYTDGYVDITSLSATISVARTNESYHLSVMASNCLGLFGPISVSQYISPRDCVPVPGIYYIHEEYIIILL
jgi:hypothetical protein